VEQFGPFQYFGSGVAGCEEFDGVVGELMGLVGVLLEDEGGEAFAEDLVHILL
jgi:hypothetical protein